MCPIYISIFLLCSNSVAGSRDGISSNGILPVPPVDERNELVCSSCITTIHTPSQQTFLDLCSSISNTKDEEELKECAISSSNLISIHSQQGDLKEPAELCNLLGFCSSLTRIKRKIGAGKVRGKGTSSRPKWWLWNRHRNRTSTAAGNETNANNATLTADEGNDDVEIEQQNQDEEFSSPGNFTAYDYEENDEILNSGSTKDIKKAMVPVIAFIIYRELYILLEL